MSPSFLKNKKLILITLIIILVCLIIYKTVIIPLNDKQDLYTSLIDGQKNKINKLNRLVSENQTVKNELNKIENKYRYFPSELELPAYLEKIIKRRNINQHLSSMTPKQKINIDKVSYQSIEIIFQDIKLDGILDFISIIENTGYLIKIDHCRLKKNVNSKFDVTVEIGAASSVKKNDL